MSQCTKMHIQIWAKRLHILYANQLRNALHCFLLWKWFYINIQIMFFLYFLLLLRCTYLNAYMNLFYFHPVCWFLVVWYFCCFSCTEKYCEENLDFSSEWKVQSRMVRRIAGKLSACLKELEFWSVLEQRSTNLQ